MLRDRSIERPRSLAGQGPDDVPLGQDAEDGTLAPRGSPGAVIYDAGAAASRVARMVGEGAVVTRGGRRLPVAIDTVCVHGDNPEALAMARAVRAGLERAGFSLRSFVSS